MLKLTTTQERSVPVRVPNKETFTEVKIPVVYKLLDRSEWIEWQAVLTETKALALTDSESLTSIAGYMREMSHKSRELLEQVFIGVPEGTKIKVDNAELEDPAEIREVLLRTQFTARAILDHYTEMMNGDGKVKN